MRLLSLSSLFMISAALQAAPAVDVTGLSPDSALRIDVSGTRITIEWPMGEARGSGVATLELAEGQPLFSALAIRSGPGAEAHVIARQLEPGTTLTVGQRDLARNGWMVFFDKVNTRPSQRFPVQRALTAASVQSTRSRAMVILDGVKAGSFSGQLVLTFYAGSAFFQLETVVHTAENSRALLYDTGLVSGAGQITRYGWIDPVSGQASFASPGAPGAPLAVKHRVIVAETKEGAIAAFPAPHRFLYPLDFVENFGFTWFGRDYLGAGDGWGIRQPPEGDKRYVPWVNAPPGSDQRLGVFYLLARAGPAEAISAVKRFTHDDRFAALPGYRTFTSHYHVEHTLTLLKAQTEAGTKEIPPALRAPGFVRAFREMGVDIVHLAEFHNGQTPKLATAERLRQLDLMHAECARLSDDTFLLLPGEEPNVHLGGHWISFFPRPVNWVLNRAAGEPFEERMPDGRPLYHVGSPADVLELMRKEQGLMWTAHARIKTSIAFPDAYRHETFFNSPHFLGAAWKAMPADYSRRTLGWRVLDLFDDMNNWGAHKHVIGEVDVFKIEPDYELYGAMNINYVKLDRLPRYPDGWQAVLDVLRRGDFFVTTGEILLPEFTVNGAPAGASARRDAAGMIRLSAKLQWTFPLAHAEIVAGDGANVIRQRVDLQSTREFGSLVLDELVPARNWKWVRLEVWDIAANGAFTQPVWVE